MTAAITCSIPSQEHLVSRGSNSVCILDIGIGAIFVSSAVCNLAAAVVDIIYNGECFLAGVVGVQGDVLGQLGIKIEGFVIFSFSGSPAVPGILILIQVGLVSIQCRLINGCAISKRECYRTFGTFHCQVNSSRNLRRCPLGVDGNVLSRHGLASKVILCLECLVQIPALELIVAGDSSRSIRLLAVTADIRLILDRLAGRTAQVDEG